MKKRMLSALLALAMLCGAVPAPAFAQDLAGSDSAIVLTDTTTDEETPASTEVTEVTEATATQEPEATPEPEATQEPEATATPEPTEAPEATATPEPTQAPEATATPVPTETPAPAGEPVPQTLGAVPSLLAANDGVSTLSAPSTLTVGGTNVLSGSYWLTNAADGTLTAEGASADNYNVKYDSATGTLTLKDATINGVDTTIFGAGIHAGGDLTIVLEGSSTVTGTVRNGDSRGIYVSGNLTIQGVGGSLTAQGADTSEAITQGISVMGSFTQQSGSVTAIGGNVNGTKQSTGLYVSGSTVTVQSGTLTATGGDTSSDSYGICVLNATVTVRDATVTATGGSGNASYGLYVYSNSPSVTLSGSSSLTARSGSATNTAGGIYFRNVYNTGSVTVGDNSTLLANSVILRASSDEKPLAPTGDGSWLIYGQSNQATPMQGDVTLPDNLTIPSGAVVTIPEGSTLNLGSHTLTVDGTLNIANQSSLAGEGTLDGSGTFNLTNPDPDITGSETLTYDGTDQFGKFDLEAPSGTVDVMGQDFTISGSASLEGWTLDTQVIKDAGTYTLTASNDTTTIEKEVTVNPATISIASATVEDKTYDGTITATVDTVTFSGLMEGDSLTINTGYTATAKFDTADAGTDKTATVTVTLKNGNYTLESNTYPLTGQTISKAAWTGETTAAGDVTPGQTESVKLPATPDGASYRSVAGSSGVCDVSIQDGALRYTGLDTVKQGTKYTVTVNVDGGNNYNDYTVAVTLQGCELMDEDTQVKLELTEVQDLPGTAFDTPQKMESELARVLVEQGSGFTAGNAAFYEVSLEYSQDGGKTWTTATAGNFPAEGITVTLPYPNGTGKDTHNFRVVHMFAVTSERLGTTAGDTETPVVTKTDAGIQVTLKGLSPVAIGWSKIETGAGGSASTPDDSIYYTCPKCGYHNWTATDEGYRCDHCGNLVTDKQLAGYPNVKGTYTPAAGSAPSAVTGVPQTGDESNMVLWLGLLFVSGLALTGSLMIAGKKKQ